MPTTNPKTLVIGAGAVGGYFGARLCHFGGIDVTFAARGKTLRALLNKGLRVTSPQGHFSLQPPVAAGELTRLKDTYDIILICVKNYHLPEVINHLDRLCHDRTLVISLLNGLGSEEILATAIGTKRVVGGLAYVAAQLAAPGIVAHTAEAKMTLGHLDGTHDPRLLNFAAHCERSGIGCHITTDITAELWKKLMWNGAFNAVTALSQAMSTEVAGIPEGIALIRSAMDEIQTVAKAHGIDLDTSAIDHWVTHTQSFQPIKTSMFQDLQNGRPLEVDALGGVIVAKAKEKGVAVPVNETLYRLLKIVHAKATPTSHGTQKT